MILLLFWNKTQNHNNFLIIYSFIKKEYIKKKTPIQETTRFVQTLITETFAIILTIQYFHFKVV